MQCFVHGTHNKHMLIFHMYQKHPIHSSQRTFPNQNGSMTRGLQAVQAEAQGLRANGTWDDTTVTTLENLKHQARVCNSLVKIAALHTFCGIKHWEQPYEQHRYKGRIVYRGDLIKNGSDEIVLYADTATTPTALVALNLALFFRSCEHNSISLSDAVQAFLQAPIEEETWVILPFELWLPEWKGQYAKGTKLVVRLKKSCTASHWQESSGRISLPKSL